MVYESAYESGHRPFKPDTKRGKWSSPQDFIFVCIGLAFKLDILSMNWFFYYRGGLLFALPYILYLFLYVVPLVVVHCFMGQFSSSGFISALRVSPLFKGMGYVAMVINYVVLSFYTIFAMLPLFMFVSSFNPTLPWSCEAFETWSINKTADFYHICNTNVTVERPTTETSAEEDINGTSSFGPIQRMHVPSILYMKKQFEGEDLLSMDINPDIKFSWTLLGCALSVWLLIAAVFYKFNTPEKLGKILRYMVCTVIAAMLIMLIAFQFLNGAPETFHDFLLTADATGMDVLGSLFTSPLMAMCAFGAGWGSIVSFASFNKFRTDIMRQSWIICLGQLGIILCLGWLSLLIENELFLLSHEEMMPHVDSEWLLFTASGSVMATMKFSNLWCLIMYGMLLLGALTIMISQLLSLLVSIFDEFEILRKHKMEVTMSIIGSLALLSIFFCCSHGVMFFSALAMDTTFTQITLNLLLLLVALWIYGRIRFQRDFEFMVGKPFANWKVICLRFVAPIGMLFCMGISLIVSGYEHYYSIYGVILVGGIVFFVIPWLFMPGYAIFIMMQTTGTLRERFRRCCMPTDWYPVEADDRQHYEEAMGNMDITHQLQEFHDDDV